MLPRLSHQIKCLAVTYSCMPAGHTTIGAERFHFRVRKGIGWFPLAKAARQTGSRCSYMPHKCDRTAALMNSDCCFDAVALMSNQTAPYIDTSITNLCMYLTRRQAKRIGCYMVKPHGQLVLVS